jgi:hypothetical protein
METVSDTKGRRRRRRRRKGDVTHSYNYSRPRSGALFFILFFLVPQLVVDSAQGIPKRSRAPLFGLCWMINHPRWSRLPSQVVCACVCVSHMCV